MNPGKLRRCPDCNGPWPPGPEYALRGTAWLSDLGRHVSQSNFDVLVHDGANGRDRFLLFELKGPSPTDWPLQKGQQWMLRALAGQPNWTVAILRGITRHVLVHGVSAKGISEEPIHTHAEAVRRAVRSWLSGGLWRDAEAWLRSQPALPAPAPEADHVHGWARVEGVWTCIQDYYAVGQRPDTGCGQTLAAF